VNLLTSLNDHVGKLVHPAVQAKPLDFARHKIFLSTRLAISLAALIIGPVCLIAGEAPAWWESGALAWLLVPFAAAAYVSRTGDLMLGETLSLTTWMGLALTLATGSGCGLALGVLLLVPLEAAVAFGSIYSLIALCVTVAIAGGLAAGSSFDLPLRASVHLGAFGACVIAAAVAYGGLLAFLASRLQRLQQHHGWIGQERYRVLAEAIDEVVMRSAVWHQAARAPRPRLLRTCPRG
jgi:two-component system, cell cycle sensor histidine kinase DivJ